MREFQDEQGVAWTASVGERLGDDYKGRYFLVMKGGEGGEAIPLGDIRWNRPDTAQKALDTMSEVELRRRLRSARGRAFFGA